jgi:hypothetical protein
MIPTRGLRMMRGFLVPARRMVFGGFLGMTRSVPLLFGRFLVRLCSPGGQSLSPRARLWHTTTRFPPPQGVTPYTSAGSQHVYD